MAKKDKRNHNRVTTGGVRKVTLNKYDTKMNTLSNEFGTAIANKDHKEAEEVIGRKDDTVRQALGELNRTDKELLEVFPYRTQATKMYSEEQVQSAFSSAYIRYQKHKRATMKQNEDLVKASSPNDLADDRVVDLVTTQVSTARRELMKVDKKESIKWDDPKDPFWNAGDDSLYTRWAIVSKDRKVLKAIAKQGLVPTDEVVLREEIDRLYDYLSMRSNIEQDPYIYPQALLDTYIEYRIILLDVARSER